MMAFVHAKLEIEETAATIAADRRFVEAAVMAIKSSRREIERQIRRDPYFLTTFEPYDCSVQDSRVVSRMCAAAALAGVGPMAAVAGAIAQEALDAMVADGCNHGWVDNGGDVALILQEPVTVEVFSEPGATNAFALELEPTDGAIGVCASSGKLGHSISLGNADVAVVMADSATLADALATAIGNRVTGPESLAHCFDPFKGVTGFVGGLAMLNRAVAMHGRIPRLTEVERNPERITAHSKMSAQAHTGAAEPSPEVRS